MRVSACSSCGRSIIWVTSPNGARMPVTARPVTVYTLDDAETPQASKHVDHIGERPFYISHFVDCPNAAQHSKAKS